MVEYIRRFKYIEKGMDFKGGGRPRIVNYSSSIPLHAAGWFASNISGALAKFE